MPRQFKFDFRFMVRALLCAAVCILCVGVPATAQQPAIVTINPPGAGTTAGLGTQGPGINSAGAITGFYADSKNVMHGFLREPDGRVTTFDAPGAGKESVSGFFGPTPGGVMGGQGTYAIAINPAGAITGFYFDTVNGAHGFLRDPYGRFTTFDAPHAYAGNGSGQGTFSANISPSGTIAGATLDGNGVYHGFLRDPGGEFTMFDAPGAGTGSGQGTLPEWASCINAAGAVTGTYIDTSNVSYGFVRAPYGTISTFEARGAGTGAGQGTNSWSINDEGAVTADYVGANGVNHGYVRDAFGGITEFDIPGAGGGAGQGTVPEGINDAGTIAGNYIDTNGVNRGFVRDAFGETTKFDVPGAGTLSGQGTIPLTINSAGVITGVYIDQEGVLHGFLRMP